MGRLLVANQQSASASTVDLATGAVTHLRPGRSRCHLGLRTDVSLAATLFQ